MPSFDVVNRLDFQEIDNAIGNAIREITNRYDFKGSDTTIERKENDLIVITDDELKVNQVHDLIITHLVLSLIHICRCRRIERCRSRWSPFH